MAGSSSLDGHFGTGIYARFSSAWSNVECGLYLGKYISQMLFSKKVLYVLPNFFQILAHCVCLGGKVGNFYKVY